MKKSLAVASLALVACVGTASASMSPLTALLHDAVGVAAIDLGTSDVVVAPTAVQTYADAYNIGVGAAHYLLGTSDPNGASCFPTSSCLATQTQISRAAYVGSFEAGPSASYLNSDGNDMVATFVFDAAAIPASHKSIRFACWNTQNFTGQAYHIQAKVIESRGDPGAGPGGSTDPGAFGILDGRGPFGLPSTGSLQTIIVDGRGERGEEDGLRGGVTVPGRGPLVFHEADPAPPYGTFDRDWVVTLGHNSHHAVETARNSGVAYTSCRHSCLGPTVRNVDCDLAISNPLYIAVSAVRGDARSSSRIQDGLAVDNIIHLHGDCDFGGEPAPATDVRCALIVTP